VSISYVLVLLGLGVFGCAVWALFWAIDDGQYDNLEAHGRSILEDDEISVPGEEREGGGSQAGNVGIVSEADSREHATR